MDHRRVSVVWSKATLPAARHLPGSPLAQDRSGPEAGQIGDNAVGEMKRAIERERQEFPQNQKQDRFASTVVIAAAIVAAVRLARDDISRPSPRLLAVIADSVSLAKVILDRVVR